ncbi:hypothetical protein D3C71_2157810 [compost metagenome]
MSFYDKSANATVTSITAPMSAVVKEIVIPANAAKIKFVPFYNPGMQYNYSDLWIYYLHVL